MNNLPENELFSAYLDGELTAGEQAQVERLLAEDPAARQLMDELRALSSTLQAMPQYELGDDIAQRVVRLAKQEMAEDEKRPATEEELGQAPPSLLKRFLSPRAVIWPLVAVGAAILIMVFDPTALRNQPGEDMIAQKPVEDESKPTGDKSRETSISAAPGSEKVDAPEGAAEVETVDAEPSRGKDFDKAFAGKGAGEGKGAAGGEGLAAAERRTNGSLAEAFADSATAHGDAPGLQAGRYAGQDAYGKAGYKNSPAKPGPVMKGGAVAGVAANGHVLAKDGGSQNRIARDAQLARTDGDVAVIHFAVSRKAMESGLVEKALGDNGIALNRAFVFADGQHGERAKSRTHFEGKASAPERESKQEAAARDLEVFYVEATSEQIQKTLLAMSEKPADVYSVSVRPSPEVGEQQTWRYYAKSGLNLTDEMKKKANAMNRSRSVGKSSGHYAAKGAPSGPAGGLAEKEEYESQKTAGGAFGSMVPGQTQAVPNPQDFAQNAVQREPETTPSGRPSSVPRPGIDNGSSTPDVPPSADMPAPTQPTAPPSNLGPESRAPGGAPRFADAVPADEAPEEARKPVEEAVPTEEPAVEEPAADEPVDAPVVVPEKDPFGPGQRGGTFAERQPKPGVTDPAATPVEPPLVTPGEPPDDSQQLIVPPTSIANSVEGQSGLSLPADMGFQTMEGEGGGMNMGGGTAGIGGMGRMGGDMVDGLATTSAGTIRLEPLQPIERDDTLQSNAILQFNAFAQQSQMLQTDDSAGQETIGNEEEKMVRGVAADTQVIAKHRVLLVIRLVDTDTPSAAIAMEREEAEAKAATMEAEKQAAPPANADATIDSAN